MSMPTRNLCLHNSLEGTGENGSLLNKALRQNVSLKLGTALHLFPVFQLKGFLASDINEKQVISFYTDSIYLQAENYSVLS